MKKGFLIILYIGWIAMIFSLSLQDATESGALSGQFVIWIENMFWLIGIDVSSLPISLMIRKTAHFTEFMILGLIGFWVFIQYISKANKAVLMSVLVGFIVAVADETIQNSVPGRDGNVLDVMIDWMGVLVGALILGYVVWKKVQKKEQNR